MSTRERENPPESQQDAAIERAWRDGSTEQPAAQMDAAIVAAAHKAVTRPVEPRAAMPARVQAAWRWKQWAPMAAAAAVAGLALTLVQTLPRDPHDAPAPAVQEAATKAAPIGVPPPARVLPAPTEPQRIETPRASDSATPDAREQPASPHTTEASPAVAASSVASVAESAADSSASAPQLSSIGAPESRSELGAARGKAVEAAVADQAAGAEQWVAKILSLHAAGDIAAAADALRAFRAVEPDADRYLPEQLREWSGSVR